MTGTWFNLKGELWNRSGGDDGQRRQWWIEFGFELKLHGDAWRRCTEAYIGV
jgi:hypothetical protein